MSDNCVGCGKQCGDTFCERCKTNLEALEKAMKENDLVFTRVEVRPA